MPEGADLDPSKVHVVGLGENATDIVMRLRAFPAPGGKQRIHAVSRQAGGSVASAMVTCRRLGLRARYLGAIGGDDNGRFQLASLRAERLDLAYVRRAEHARSRVSHIAIDESTGERTIFWERDRRLDFPPGSVTREMLAGAAILHLDATDLRAAVQAARLARRAGITTVADLDTVAPGVERLLPLADYPIVSSDFLAPATGERDPFPALARLARDSGARLVGVTLGRDGALVLTAGRFLYSPGFCIDAVDTTGAGDIFHGAFIYGLVREWKLEDILDFSNAMAALNSTALGARGGIASERAARRLMARGSRNVNRDYAHRARGDRGAAS
jgi:sulfofructose kinase